MLKSIKYTLISMLVVFKHLFKKKITLEYPEKKKNPEGKFRGLPKVQGCIKCGTCFKVCPTNAITINNDEFRINLEKCIFCGNCAFYCPKNAIEMSKEYELATSNKNDLKLSYKIEEENKNERN